MQKKKIYQSPNICSKPYISDTIIINVYVDKSGYEYEIYNFITNEMLDIKKLLPTDQRDISKIINELLKECCEAIIERRTRMRSKYAEQNKARRRI